jgi:hypothetical protein
MPASAPSERWISWRANGALALVALDRAVQRPLIVTAPAIALGRDRPRRHQRIYHDDPVRLLEEEAEHQLPPVQERRA